MSKHLLFVLSLAGVVACGSPGRVVVTTYGEDFIEQAIPADEVEDGWTIMFSKFLVSIGEIKIASSDGTVGAERKAARIYDVKKPGPAVVAELSDVEDRAFDLVGYAISPAADAAAGNADAADVALMKAAGHSVYVEGSATKEGRTKTFRWGFGTNTLYEHCMREDGKQGVTVPSGGEVKVEITIHGDHLFLDDLQSAESKVRFDALADADTDEDGEVTLEELSRVELESLPAARYGTGGVANVNDLRAFVTAQVHSLGHFQGEGECQPRSR